MGRIRDESDGKRTLLMIFCQSQPRPKIIPSNRRKFIVIYANVSSICDDAKFACLYNILSPQRGQHKQRKRAMWAFAALRQGAAYTGVIRPESGALQYPKRDGRERSGA
jgi:hypothetical protein